MSFIMFLGSILRIFALTDSQHLQQQQQVRHEAQQARKKPATLRPRMVNSPTR